MESPAIRGGVPASSQPHEGFGPKLEITRNRSRVTPPPAGGRFKEVLGDSANVLMSGIEAASVMVPAGPVMSAAVRSARGATTSTGGGAGGGLAVQGSGATGTGESAESPGGSAAEPGYGGMMGQFADDSMRLILLQQQIQQENRQFTTMSNVIKARHETAKNAIGNLR